MLLPRIAKRSGYRGRDSLSSQPSGWCRTRRITTHAASSARGLAPLRLAPLIVLWLLLVTSILHASDAAPRDRFSTSLSGSRRSWLDPPLSSLVSGRRRPQPQRSAAVLPYSYYSSRYSTSVHRTRRSSSTTSCHNNFNARISSRRFGRSNTVTRAATIFPPTAAVVAATSNTDSLKGDSSTDDNSSGSDVASSYNYDDLTWLGWGIAAAVEIGFTVLIEYATGFIGGYFLGSLADIPRFLRTPSGSTTNQQQRAFWNEFLSRAGRTNAKAVQWGSSWAGISAAFGGIDVAVRVARHGKRDEWNTILSSVAAGAWFARKGELWLLSLF